MTKIYTKSGDDGSTGLFGGPRTRKSARRVAAYGDVDELNCVLGEVLAIGDAIDPIERQRLADLQCVLFDVGGELATHPEAPRDWAAKVPKVEPSAALALEQAIDRMTAEIPVQTHFVMPGGIAAAARLHTARTVCRRAERTIADLAEHEPVRAELLVFVNRLSDYLFVLARHTNHRSGTAEPKWEPKLRAAKS